MEMCTSPSRRLRWVLVILAILPLSSLAGSASVLPIAIPHPVTMLLRAESVHRELGLAVDQIASIREGIKAAELPLWRLRDLPADERARAAGPLLDALRHKLGTALTDRQLKRLDQLVLQAQGVRATLDPPVADALKLSSAQKAGLQAILARVTRHGNAAQAERSARAILSPRQHRVLASLTGPAFDISSVPQVACRAPELEGVTAWINSSPLTLAQLRGRVVLVHFYAFGCINCVRNLPHYNAWRERFAERDVAILGIHRPETEAERDIGKVREKSIAAGLTYPVAVDNDSRNWEAWANRVWPSVYLIDRAGFVRYWWYGELNWQDTPGERWMRERIAELVAAPPDSL